MRIGKQLFAGMSFAAAVDLVVQPTEAPGIHLGEQFGVGPADDLGQRALEQRRHLGTDKQVAPIRALHVDVGIAGAERGIQHLARGRQLRLVVLALGDVHGDTGQTDNAALRVEDWRLHRQEAALLRPTPRDTVLALLDGLSAGQHQAVGFIQFPGGIRVEQFGRAPARHIRRRKPHHLGEALVGIGVDTPPVLGEDQGADGIENGQQGTQIAPRLTAWPGLDGWLHIPPLFK